MKKAAWQSQPLRYPSGFKGYRGRAIFVKQKGVEFMIMAQDITDLRTILAAFMPLMEVNESGCLPSLLGPDPQKQ